MRRTSHPYHKWEDYQAGMYQQSDRADEHRASSHALLADPVTLEQAMRNVTAAWPVATEHQLTALDTNRRAWLGAAACCHTHGAREHAVRDAWWTLTEPQQRAANAAADAVIDDWEAERLGGQGLFPIRRSLKGGNDA